MKKGKSGNLENSELRKSGNQENTELRKEKNGTRNKKIYRRCGEINLEVRPHDFFSADLI